MEIIILASDLTLMRTCLRCHNIGFSLAAHTKFRPLIFESKTATSIDKHLDSSPSTSTKSCHEPQINQLIFLSQNQSQWETPKLKHQRGD